MLNQELDFLFVKGGEMKKKFSMYLNIILMVVVMTFVLGGFAAGNNPGGPSDPVVTQSYVEGRIQALNDSIQAQFNTIGATQGVTQNYVDSGIQTLNDSIQTQISNIDVTTTDTASFIVISVNAGQTITLEENAQFILRTGEATAIGGPGGGLSDLTAGVDLLTNDTVSRNHLILIPRTDGRGVYFKTQAYIMVNGKYTLE